MEHEWVSIVLPTYNRAVELRQSVQSVLEQTYREFELIIVDDGSTDDTAQVVQEFGDERIRYCRMPENGGQSKARNYGMKLAQYEYIAFQDSDDRWHSDKLELQMQAFLEHPEAGFVYHKYRYTMGGDEKVVPPEECVPLEQKSGMIYEQLLWANLVGMPTLMIKRECLEKVGYLDESLRSLEDYDFALRLSQHYQAVFIDKILLEAGLSPEGVSADKIRECFVYCLLVQRHKQAYIETGILAPKLETILKIAKILGMEDKITLFLEEIMEM